MLDKEKRAEIWINKLAYEEVCKYQEACKENNPEQYAQFSKADVRQIRRNIVQRILKNRRNENTFGFTIIGWLLLTVLSSAISFAIRKWLDKIFPNEEGTFKTQEYWDKVIHEIEQEG